MIEYFEYLDNLRKSGETNMFGAAPFLQEEFALEYDEAKKITKKWMMTFDSEKTVKQRVQLSE